MGTASDAVSAYQKIDNWLSFGSSAVDAILRPLVQWMAEPLDSVTGDAEEVRAAGTKWQDAAKSLRDVVDQEKQAVARVQGSWEGEAADAFAASMKDLCAAMEALASSMEETKEFLDDAAMEVQMAEELVETIIRELIEWAIITLLSALALSVISFGASAAAGAATVAAEAAVAGSRIARVLATVARVLKKVSELLKMAKLTSRARALRAGDKKAFMIGQFSSMVFKAGAQPVIKGLTGLTGSPLGESVDTAVDNASKIAADEFDDTRSGDTGPRTPVREKLNPAE